MVWYSCWVRMLSSGYQELEIHIFLLEVSVEIGNGLDSLPGYP
jgi:hypothetical protein